MKAIYLSIILYATAQGQYGNSTPDDTVITYSCPKGFFRAGNTCYFLSTKKTTWKRAFYECENRKNSTLAAPDSRWKDKFLRRYLRRNPDKKYRWIAGMYNWKKENWVWATTGNDFKHEAFKTHKPKSASWMCTVMDPLNYFKWTSSSCLSHFHFICEKPMRARRKNKKRRKAQKKKDRNNNVEQFKFDPNKLFWIPEEERAVQINY